MEIIAILEFLILCEMRLEKWFGPIVKQMQFLLI